MIESLPTEYPKRLTRAGAYLADILEPLGQPVVTPFTFYQCISQMYRDQEGKRLYLRRETPNEADYTRLRHNLKRAGIVGHDRDYGTRLIRILTISDMPAEEVVCLADPLCYVSHLSAMQRWGLTDRRSDALLLTRPNRSVARARIRAIVEREQIFETPAPYSLKHITHPEQVRRRNIHTYDTQTYGSFVKARGSFVRLATIGQTFLDTLQKSELCGGMSHVLDVWQNHAENYFEEIIEAVNTGESKLTKSRAGYILQEHLGFDDGRIEAWKAFGQRGSSRKLDPFKEFAPEFSETWMISLNA